DAEGRMLGEDQAEALMKIAVSGRVLDVLVGPAGAGKTTATRSEERRVGKECRSRWSTCHYRKKISHYLHTPFFSTLNDYMFLILSYSFDQINRKITNNESLSYLPKFNYNIWQTLTNNLRY